MGALFLIIPLIILLLLGIFLGLAGVTLGMIGAVIRKRNTKIGKPTSSAFGILCSVALVVGSIMTILPTAFFGFILLVNTLPPDGFVQTDITIEEDGYQDTRFTADGVVYEVLSMELYDLAAMGEPVFTYQTSGFLNGSQCGNYYLVPNEGDFSLVCDEFGVIFCPAEQKEAVYAYYYETQHHAYFLGDWGEPLTPMSNRLHTEMDTYLGGNKYICNYVWLELEEGTYEEFSLMTMSCDSVICIKQNRFVLTEIDEQLYCINLLTYEEGAAHYSAHAVPKALADILIAEYQATQSN